MTPTRGIELPSEDHIRPHNPATGSSKIFDTENEPSPPFHATVDLFRQEHLNAARASVQDPCILQELEAEIERDCGWLKSFLSASQVINEISLRSRDTIVRLGERFACNILTDVLRDQGIDAEYVSLEGIVPTDDDVEETKDRSLDPELYDYISHAVGERVKQCGPRMPVVSGIFSLVPGSVLRQIRSGYTDLLSALLAVGLEAAELQIWKEVDGIFTADHRKVATARLIPIISSAEAAELTYYGSEVAHPLAMEQAIRYKIPIRIKNLQNPRGTGIVIQTDSDADIAHVEDVARRTPEPRPPLKLAYTASYRGDDERAHRHPQYQFCLWRAGSA
ncbi:Aspartate/glutamate/uridylate kinase [Mycena galopus ATCC 62051]|nr:Aspartate/glutamate/uridylate kinase [Mycena galopus ATCC 62051]